MVIDASSPLAAMQHQPFMTRCGGFGQESLDYASFARASFGPNSFNFKDLSMLGRQPPLQRDYFSMPPPVRGSSPTASLAADLSQNMNIDRSSPQYPTPRRALFGSNVFCPRGQSYGKNGIGNHVTNIEQCTSPPHPPHLHHLVPQIAWICLHCLTSLCEPPTNNSSLRHRGQLLLRQLLTKTILRVH